jgi:putative membrane protein
MEYQTGVTLEPNRDYCYFGCLLPGLKNNASYNRTWGGLVNNSRTFGAAVTSFLQGENVAAIHQRLSYRHIAWLTALRFQLRLSREWEQLNDRMKSICYPETTDY